VATQDEGRKLPGDGGAGLDLRPRDLRVVATAIAENDNEVVDAALTLTTAQVPVLHRRVLDLSIIQRDQFNDCRMKLVLVTLRSGTTFQIRDVRSLFRDDQRAVELTGIALVDAEIGGKLHRATNALRNVHERTVGKDCGIQ